MFIAVKSVGICLLFYTNLNICTIGVDVEGNRKEHLKLISYLQVKELSNDQEKRDFKEF